MSDVAEVALAERLDEIQGREGDILAAVQRSEIGERLGRSGWAGSAHRLEKQDAREYLLAYEAAAADQAAEIVSSMSSGEWLWYLRRVPAAFTAGSVRTTSGYVREVAETMSGASEALPTHEPGRYKMGYVLPVNDFVARNVLALIKIARLVTYTHSMARWCGKGAALKRQADGYPYAVEVQNIKKFVQIYDDRMSRDYGNLLGGLGTALPALNKRGVFTSRGVQMQFFAETRDAESITLPHPVTGQEIHFVPNFWRTGVPFNHVIDLVENLDHSTARPDDGILGLNLLLLQTASDLLGVSPGSTIDMLRRGYSIMTLRTLKSELGATLRSIRADVDTDSLPFVFPDSADAALQSLLSWQGTTFPLFPSAPIRELADAVILDVVGATTSLRRILTYSPADGEIANVRGRHFERKLQELIDSTPARPNGMARKLINRKVKRKGSNYTDIDAVAELNGTLFLIDCKSKRYDEAYETGAWSAVKNLRDALDKDATKWQEQIKTIARERLATELEGFNDIRGFVCTPFVPYLENEDSLQYVIDGLRVVASSGEFEAWINQNGPERV
ncbi:hypothetical protein [Symbioplanes lichenis]|uniref:hypothetical protein n=1 Tax=Symbioplanes lichenis TaxID=1629072 RepID=UPI002739A5CD|nr:hypothetical protein [Actinoplanes lichenis]